MKKATLLFAISFLNCFAFSQKVTAKYPLLTESGKPAKVEISIIRESTSGIARMQLELPKGIKAIGGSGKEALFSFSSQLVQFLWIQLPLDTNIRFDFTVIPDSNYSGVAEIGGRFSYIVDNKKKEVTMAPILLKVTGYGEKLFEKYKTPTVKVTATKQPQAKQSQAIKLNESIAKNKTITSVKTLEKPKEAKTSNSTNILVKQAPKEKSKTDIKNNVAPKSPINAAKKENISFRIQLAASASMLDKSQLSRDFSCKIEMINEELINNMYKYTTGEFSTFKEAKKVLTLNELLKGKAFIVGYKDGKRIDLEEAIQQSK